VLIVVRNPASSSRDLKLKRPLLSSVFSLKEVIALQYPEKPHTSSQKLFFAGKLLSDQAILTDILKQHDKTRPVTFHLVISNFTSENFPQGQGSNPLPPHSFSQPAIPHLNPQNLPNPPEDVPNINQNNFNQHPNPNVRNIHLQFRFNLQVDLIWVIIQIAFLLFIFSHLSNKRLFLLVTTSFFPFLVSQWKVAGDSIYVFGASKTTTR